MNVISTVASWFRRRQAPAAQEIPAAEAHHPERAAIVGRWIGDARLAAGSHSMVLASDRSQNFDWLLRKAGPIEGEAAPMVVRLQAQGLAADSPLPLLQSVFREARKQVPASRLRDVTINFDGIKANLPDALEALVTLAAAATGGPAVASAVGKLAGVIGGMLELPRSLSDDSGDRARKLLGYLGRLSEQVPLVIVVSRFERLPSWDRHSFEFLCDPENGAAPLRRTLLIGAFDPGAPEWSRTQGMIRSLRRFHDLPQITVAASEDDFGAVLRPILSARSIATETQGWLRHHSAGCLEHAADLGRWLQRESILKNSDERAAIPDGLRLDGDRHVPTGLLHQILKDSDPLRVMWANRLDGLLQALHDDVERARYCRLLLIIARLGAAATRSLIATVMPACEPVSEAVRVLAARGIVEEEGGRIIIAYPGMEAILQTRAAAEVESVEVVVRTWREEQLHLASTNEVRRTPAQAVWAEDSVVQRAEPIKAELRPQPSEVALLSAAFAAEDAARANVFKADGQVVAGFRAFVDAAVARIRSLEDETALLRAVHGETLIQECDQWRRDLLNASDVEVEARAGIEARLLVIEALSYALQGRINDALTCFQSASEAATEADLDTMVFELEHRVDVLRDAGNIAAAAGYGLGALSALSDDVARVVVTRLWLPDRPDIHARLVQLGIALDSLPKVHAAHELALRTEASEFSGYVMVDLREPEEMDVLVERARVLGRVPELVDWLLAEWSGSPDDFIAEYLDFDGVDGDAEEMLRSATRIFGLFDRLGILAQAENPPLLPRIAALRALTQASLREAFLNVIDWDDDGVPASLRSTLEAAAVRSALERGRIEAEEIVGRTALLVELAKVSPGWRPLIEEALSEAPGAIGRIRILVAAIWISNSDEHASEGDVEVWARRAAEEATRFLATVDENEEPMWSTAGVLENLAGTVELVAKNLAPSMTATAKTLRKVANSWTRKAAAEEREDIEAGQVGSEPADMARALTMTAGESGRAGGALTQAAKAIQRLESMQEAGDPSARDVFFETLGELQKDRGTWLAIGDDLIESALDVFESKEERAGMLRRAATIAREAGHARRELELLELLEHETDHVASGEVLLERVLRAVDFENNEFLRSSLQHVGWRAAKRKNAFAAFAASVRSSLTARADALARMGAGDVLQRWPAALQLDEEGTTLDYEAIGAMRASAVGDDVANAIAELCGFQGTKGVRRRTNKEGDKLVRELFSDVWERPEVLGGLTVAKAKAYSVAPALARLLDQTEEEVRLVLAQPRSGRTLLRNVFPLEM